MKIRAKKLVTLAEKSRGLIGADPVYAVYFTTRWGIHTFGMKATIDVVILDEEFLVVSLATLPPNRIYIWNPKHRHVLELPEGQIKKYGIFAGSAISITAS